MLRAMIRSLALAAACCLPAGGALAHPHIFITTALELQVDDTGRLTGVVVTWDYDEMYSMLLLDELQLDPDYDGILTEAELAELDGYDLNWMEGFEGDLYVSTAEGRPVTLGPPEGLGVSFDDQTYASRHLRPLERPRPASGLVVKAYDPGFYTAYDLGGGVTVSGNPACSARIIPPEIDESYKDLAAELAELPPDAEGYPQVGETFAETVQITCETKS
ncbi:ABC-type uncharacterized transport system, substrate-binding protein [Pseudooceanicola antarcticus]|nr:ABC-type uncharacterized transport system, substrate-binding protein [Pseudooceanicola antarcticus]